jgi:8-oxo-dGTP pyrophosphatase MutT (NUDIX family)
MPKYRWNRYRDIEIDVSRLGQFTGEVDFCDIIRQEHDKWYSKLKYPRVQDMAVMWLNVPKEFSRVVPWLLAMCPPFILHHANSQRIMLVRPANPRSRSQIPAYGTHYVKVECVVVEENTGRVLMVRERLGSAEAVIKLVTGATDTGEFVAVSAEREVWEETGVRANTVSLVGCGNRLRTRFDRDEIIFGLLLYAKEGQTPKPDGFEVRDAMWMTVSEATSHCTAMAREWLAAASASRTINVPRTNVTDLFRGHPHTMDFFVPRA